MKKEILIICLMILSLNKTFSQNLVPNASFEEYQYCDSFILDGTLMDYVVDWYEPNGWSSDYFKDFEVPCAIYIDDFSSYQSLDPYIGNSHVGSYYYAPQGEGETREYIGVELYEELFAGQLYEVSWWVALAGFSKYRINSMGAYFSNEALNEQTAFNAFEVTPQVEIIDFIGNTISWVQIKDTMLALGGEKFITIGCFKHDDEILLEQINENDDEYSYYTIDMVEVKQLVTDIKENPVNFISYFYYSQPEKLIKLKNSSNQNCTYSMYQINGSLLKSFTTNKSEVTISCENYANSLYFLTAKTDQGLVTKKIVIN